jgi:hypothetical protein
MWTYTSFASGFLKVDSKDLAATTPPMTPRSYLHKLQWPDFGNLYQDVYPKRNEPNEAKTPTRNCLVVLTDARASYAGQLTW